MTYIIEYHIIKYHIAYRWEELRFSIGSHSEITDDSLLVHDYNKANPQHLGTKGYSDIYKNYPIFPADSELNNNIRYWRRPTNGTCVPPELCGGFYRDTVRNIPPNLISPVPNQGIRVNYYDSSA